MVNNITKMNKIDPTYLFEYIKNVFKFIFKNSKNQPQKYQKPKEGVIWQIWKKYTITHLFLEITHYKVKNPWI